jgi:hypothetical protein
MNGFITRGLGGIMSVPPCVGGPIPPSKPKIQNTYKNIWFLEPKSLNLGVWLFEIEAPVEF